MIGDESLKVIIAGGGTAGHINPGLAIAKEIMLNNKDCDILFVGAKTGLEKDLVPKEGFNLKLINVKGFKRKLSKDTIISFKELTKGMFQARKILKEFKPDIVIGTGGYVCGPVLLNASLLKIPTLIHEQNVIPGATNKILSKFVDAVLISFEETKKYIKSKRIILTGNPIRQEIVNANKDQCKKELGLTKEKLLLVFGGSIGAQKINDTMMEYIRLGVGDNIKVIFATGAKEFDSVIKKLNKYIKVQDNIEIRPYIDNMHVVLPAADLVLCRAGAITLSEVTALGIPCILIPSPNVTHNHQEYNARALEKQGAAEVLLESQLDKINIKEYIDAIINDDKLLVQMSQHSKNIGIIDASKKIYQIIMDMVK